MLMRYNTFLFDFDYTLVNSSAGIVKCFRTVLDKHEYFSPTDEEIRRTIGKTLEESFSILTGEVNPEVLHTYRQEYVAEADIHMTSNTFLFPETKEVLTTLKQRGVKLGIISTKYKYRIKEFLDIHFPEDFFDIIIGIEEVEKYKPHPDGILKAIKFLKSKKKQVIYIGDSTTDAEAAQNAEVDFIGVTHGVTTTRELAAYQNVAIIPELSPILSLSVNRNLTKHLRRSKLKSFNRYFNYRKHIGHTKSIDPYKHYVCNNCGTYFIGEYCNTCGQRRNTGRFTFSYVIKNMLGGLTSIDDKFLRNLIELLYRPGYMIFDYIKGKRSHYFKPFQTLFILVAIYIILVKILDPLSFMNKDKEVTYKDIKRDITTISSKAKHQKTKALLTKSSNYLDSAYSTALPIEKSYENEVKFDINNDPTTTKFVTYLIKNIINIVNPESKKDNSEPTFIDGIINVINNWAKDNKTLSLIMLIPLYTIATKRAFRKNSISKGFNYTETLFVQVYIACQIILISIILLPFLGHGEIDEAFGISWWLIFLLYWWDFRQLFKDSWKKTFKRTVIMFIYLGLIMFALIILILILVTLWTAISMI